MIESARKTDIDKWANKQGWLRVYSREGEALPNQSVFLTPNGKKIVINFRGDEMWEFLVIS